MRIKYGRDFEEYLIKNAKEKTASELVKIAEEKFNIKTTDNNIRNYCLKRGIKYKYKNKNMIRKINCSPLGIERIHQGLIQVKVSKYKWEYKQRLIYEKYHNVKLTNNDYIIFLDQNRNNLDINNLKRITAKESSFMINRDLFSKIPEVTELGINVTKLKYKTEEIYEKL